MQNRKSLDLNMDQYVDVLNFDNMVECAMDDLMDDIYRDTISLNLNAIEQDAKKAAALAHVKDHTQHILDEHCKTTKANLKTARENAVSVLKNGIFTAKGRELAEASASKLAAESSNPSSDSDTEIFSSPEVSPVTPRM
ncbi:MAG TPA: hypothetical protein VL360_06195 [Gammaproteobacteria bacterium]|jgi:hypothetical protein|nr:hypothetical protein [Gammaproteobacteria bacterium]